MFSDDYSPKESHSFMLKGAARIAVASLLASTAIVIGTASPAMASRSTDMVSMPNPGAGDSNVLSVLTDVAKDQLRTQLLRILGPSPKKVAPAVKKRK